MSELPITNEAMVAAENLLAVISKQTGQTEDQARSTVLRALDRALGKKSTDEH